MSDKARFAFGGEEKIITRVMRAANDRYNNNEGAMSLVFCFVGSFCFVNLKSTRKCRW